MRKTGLLIDSVKGETALSILNELDLVDRRFKVGRTKSKLRIPLARLPNVLELELIETRLGKFSTAEDEYEPHPEKPESLDEALALLPPEARASLPRAFDIIGDLAIVELAPETTAYQSLIAQALMTVHTNVKGVYSKAGPVSGEERIRPLKHLAGEARTSTIHKEFGCSFKVDIARAFYSPRLSGEHKRVADLVEPGEHVIDMFAGVGPFPILIAKQLSKVTVDAIDLNPEATRLLEENLRLKHVKGILRQWLGRLRWTRALGRRNVYTLQADSSNQIFSPGSTKSFIICRGMSSAALSEYTISVRSDTNPLLLTTISLRSINLNPFAPRPSILTTSSRTRISSRPRPELLLNNRLISSGKSPRPCDDLTPMTQSPRMVRF